MKAKSLLLASLVIGSILILSATRIHPVTDNPSNNRDTFPPPQNLWLDTLACIAYWDEPGVDSLPDGYYVTLGSFQPWDYTDCTYYDIPEFLEYGYTTYIDVWAKYGDSLSSPASDTFTSGYLPIPRNLEAETWDDVVALTWEVPHRPDTTPAGSWPYWVHANFPCAGIPNEYGVETDGDYIYTTQSNGNLIFRYDMDAGILINSFTINGVNNLRDLAYNDDNGLFYGGNGGHTCYVMDFMAGTLISTFTAPVEIQAIAWDEDQQALWACSWSSDIMLFDLSGNLITSIPNPSMNYTGLAYDVDSDGGPYLWGFTDHYGGADLVKIDIISGAILGHMSVYPRVGGSGPPGGLFVARNVFVPAATTLGGILQNDRIFGLELFNWNGIPPPMVPPNLLGYNLYVDNDSLDYIPISGEDTTVYYDTNSYPFSSYIEYEVSAVYDMEPYGMPGDTGESYPEGPIQVYYQDYSILPFEEDWTSGSFAMQEWENDDNWEIISQIGNPEPCARFQGDVMTNEYTSNLTSRLIDGKGLGDPYVDGCMWLEFHIMLDDNNATGDEILKIEIGNEFGWHEIATYDNSFGSFDWESQMIDITAWSHGQMFRLRFSAVGLNSTDIYGWYIDNIEITRICMPVKNLDYVLYAGIEAEVHLHWYPPYKCMVTSGEGEWLFWDEGLSVGGIGLTGGGTFSVASRWEPDMLSYYDDMAITKIRFVPNYNALNSQFILRVWEGPNAGTLLIDQAVTSYIAGEWNEFELAQPLFIDVNKELWFGYTCDSPDGENPAGYDAGPAVAGYGDMITLDGVTWDPISSFGAQFDLNWSLQAWVCDPTLDHGREIQGYKVLKEGEYLAFTNDTFFVDYIPYGSLYSPIMYDVIAVYEDCESEEYTVVILIGIDEYQSTGTIVVFPNPTQDYATIRSPMKMHEVRLFNKIGMLVLQKEISGTKLQVNTSNLESGVYMVRALLEDGTVVSRKVVVYK